MSKETHHVIIESVGSLREIAQRFQNHKVLAVLLTDSPRPSEVQKTESPTPVSEPKAPVPKTPVEVPALPFDRNGYQRGPDKSKRAKQRKGITQECADTLESILEKQSSVLIKTVMEIHPRFSSGNVSQAIQNLIKLYPYKYEYYKDLDTKFHLRGIRRKKDE